MTPEQLARFAGRAINQNMSAFLAGMEKGGHLIQWNRPTVKAHILGQVGHESLGFLYDREIWGPTKAQSGYEDRPDLGHSPAISGEAFKYRGRGPIQTTGRANYREISLWMRAKIDPRAPDFETNPDLLLTDPWEGLSVVWYWETRGLTLLALKNDFENITRRINGGLNGYNDRMRWFARAALVILGKDPSGIRAYQAEKGLSPVDGIAGTNTRRALFTDLDKLPDDANTVVHDDGSDYAGELSKLRNQIDRIKAITEE